LRDRRGRLIDSAVFVYIRSEKAPLLVLQGDNDPLVAKEEAQQLVDILKKEGRLVDVHYYPDEGHVFMKRENYMDAIRRTIRLVRINTSWERAPHHSTRPLYSHR
jgi:dipeptidyl aminopeptidase/acylaminoacyl peptidase